LSRDVDFVEARGEERDLHLPTGSLRRYVPSEPSGTWALNLALLARPPARLSCAAGMCAARRLPS
jgi:hypothetical protein